MRPATVSWIVVATLMACGDSDGSTPTPDADIVELDVAEVDVTLPADTEVVDDADTSVPQDIDTSTPDTTDPVDVPDAPDTIDTTDTAPTEVTVGLESRVANTTCRPWSRPANDFAGASWEWWPPSPPEGIDAPIFMSQAPGNPNRFYILSRTGRVQTFIPGDAVVQTALDLRSDVNDDFEGGFLGLAFHPRFGVDNRWAFIHYTRNDTTANADMRSVVIRVDVSTDGLTFSDPVDILADTRLRQPFANHNGGWIGFSPIDGYLYIALGDGGVGAQSAASRNPASLLGKILRIDVDGVNPDNPAIRYTIPSDNPFVDVAGAAPEVWAMGFRNPYRASFDRDTGDLWVADVGESRIEEVSVVERGGDYGWPCFEGTLVMRSSGNCANVTGTRVPLLQMRHNDGWVSIIGGYVYRGSAIPGLQGRFLFADFIRKGVFAETRDTNGVIDGHEELFADAGGWWSMSEDLAGELYGVTGWGGIYKLVPGSTAPAPSPVPDMLSATGCVDPQDPTRVAPGVVPYGVQMELWSDGAAKDRYFALPDAVAIEVTPDGAWDFPIGAMLIKHFRRAGRPIETRFMVRHDDGDWGGYSYAWNDAGTDATLLRDGATRDAPGGLWQFPSRAQCFQCHTSVAGEPGSERPLGLETQQLAADFTYPGNRVADQYVTLQTLGYLVAPSTPAVATYPRIDGPLDAATRAYLDVNCASCHQPGGPGRGGLDLRHETPLSATGICNVRPTHGDLGLTDAHLIAPGSPERSVLLARMRSDDHRRMPPLGTLLIDDAGADLIEAWVDALTTCD
jgi:uncharacterized repeat protein (TIGR03806 family)